MKVPVSRAALALFFFAACSRELSIPEPRQRPSILNLKPTAAFAGDRVVVYGEHFDAVGNQLTFGDGVTVLAEVGADGGDLSIDGGLNGAVRGLSFVVPTNLQTTAPVVLANTVGRSAPSAEAFVPLGNGFPNRSEPVASLKFRHAPVGLIDREENVLLASSLFNILVTDARDFSELPGRIVALVPVPSDADAGFVAYRTPTGSQVALVSASNGEVLARGPDRAVIEEYALPGVPPSVGLSIGSTPEGTYVVTDWQRTGASLTGSPSALPIRQFLGASASGTTLAVVGIGNTTGPEAQVFFTSAAGTRAIYPVLPDGSRPPCTAQDEVACGEPSGPVAVVPRGDGGLDVVVALTSGDLAIVDAAQPTQRRKVSLISYAGIDDLAAGLSPGKVIFTKSRDGALFQYDLSTDELEWAVQLRGEPTRIAVAPEIDEIAVANRTENSVDTVVASTGQWSGRIAVDLGLGAAPGFSSGGMVAAYSYDPARWAAGAPAPAEDMQLLMRNIGTVLTMDASSFEARKLTRLDTSRGEPLALVPVQPMPRGDFVTLVVHRTGLGVIEAGQDERYLLDFDPNQGAPIDVVPLANGAIGVSFIQRAVVYSWSGAGLASGAPVDLVGSSRLAGIVANGNNLMVVTRQGTRHTITERSPPGMQMVNSWEVNAGADTYADFIKGVALRSGPAFFFGDAQVGGARGPHVWFTSENDPSIPSLISGLEIMGVSPDGQHVVWRDARSADAIVRVITASPLGVSSFSSYRLAGQPAGPGFDPSGEWLYLPIPSLDQLDIVQ